MGILFKTDQLQGEKRNMNKRTHEDINRLKKIMDYDVPIDHKTMVMYIDEFAQRYPFIEINSLGRTMMGRDIPIIALGTGKKSILYVGAHHGMEWITSAVLLRFINEYCELYKRKGRIYNMSIDYLYESRTIYVVPMLNPDGVDYQLNGVSEDNVLYDRLIRMNNGSEDFSHWQANGRGVDLNHNYNCGFAEYKKLEYEMNIIDGAPTKYSGEYPESEAEVAYLCNFMRFRYEDKPGAAISLHTQGKEIYYSSMGKSTPRSPALAKSFARMSGYSLSVPEGSAAYGGMLDWCIHELRIPAFTFECGKGENPLPADNMFEIYTDLREVLFCAPNMI